METSNVSSEVLGAMEQAPQQNDGNKDKEEEKESVAKEPINPILIIDSPTSKTK